jgi:hypothetical protein
MGYAFVVISFVLYQFYKRLCCFRCWWQYYFVEAFVPRTCWSTCWSWIMFKKNFSAAIIKEIFMLLNKWNTFYLMNLWKAVRHFVLWITLIYYINITLLGERGVTADIFTKAMDANQLGKLRGKLGIYTFEEL